MWWRLAISPTTSIMSTKDMNYSVSYTKDNIVKLKRLQCHIIAYLKQILLNGHFPKYSNKLTAYNSFSTKFCYHVPDDGSCCW